MSKKRPVHLNLFTIHFPVMAIVSILHRVTGVLLYLVLPVLLYLLSLSLRSSEGFEYAKTLLSAWPLKTALWLVFITFFYHFFAGIRHLLMDIHIGDTKLSGRVGSYVVFAVTGLTAVFLGVWLW